MWKITANVKLVDLFYLVFRSGDKRREIRPVEERNLRAVEREYFLFLGVSRVLVLFPDLRRFATAVSADAT